MCGTNVNAGRIEHVYATMVSTKEVQTVPTNAERKAGLLDALVADEHLGHAQGVLVFDANHWSAVMADNLTPEQIADRLVEIAFGLTGECVQRTTVGG